MPKRPPAGAGLLRQVSFPILLRWVAGLVLLCAAGLPAQLPPGTSDSSAAPEPSSTQANDALRLQATEALDAGDYPRALRVLRELAAQTPKDAHILFDLASAQDALDQTSPAESTYRRAIAADPTYFEPHLGLGLLLARQGQGPAGRAELLSAVALKSPDPALMARAYRALAHVDATINPAEARDALLAALKLSPETPDDTLLSAAIAQKAHDPAAAEQALRDALKNSPGDPAITADLAHLLLAGGQTAEAETILKQASASHPDQPALQAELANAYARQGKYAEALALGQPLHQARPADPAVSRLYVRLLLQAGRYADADPILAQLSEQAPADAGLLDDRADTLIHLHRSPEAEALLHRALAQPGSFPNPQDRAEAEGRLAFAASQNNHPEVVLQALDARATVLPQSPSTLFLAATANDRLHRSRKAAELYRQFLSAANGKFPDEEFEARHRLITLAHMR